MVGGGSGKKKQSTIQAFFGGGVARGSARRSAGRDSTAAFSKKAGVQAANCTPVTVVDDTETPDGGSSSDREVAVRRGMGANAQTLKRALFEDARARKRRKQSRREEGHGGDGGDTDVVSDDNPDSMRDARRSDDDRDKEFVVGDDSADSEDESYVAIRRKGRRPVVTKSPHSGFLPSETRPAKQQDVEMGSVDEGCENSDSQFPLLELACSSRNTDSCAAPATKGQSGKPIQSDKARRVAREKLAAFDSNGAQVGQEEGGWCSKHSWSTNIRDSQKRKVGDPGYDKTTLYIPESAFSGDKKAHGFLSPFQRQFWKIKMNNYDSIIFFKKGKFYELYDVDADIGHRELGLNYTKGGRVDMRCCGVPEQSFGKHIARLIDLGFKVGRVEQTETANAAEKRKSSPSANKSAVCERSLVRILTKATVTEEGLLRDHRARYVLAVKEGLPRRRDSAETVANGFCENEDGSTNVTGTDDVSPASVTVGVCYVDAASGSITIGEFVDDFRRSQTERLMIFLRPQELIIDAKGSSERLSSLAKWTCNTSGAELVQKSGDDGFPFMTSEWLRKYLSPSSPSVVQETEPGKYEQVLSYISNHPLGCQAFGATACYLKSLIIDKETLSLGNYNMFPQHDTPIPNATRDADRKSMPDDKESSVESHALPCALPLSGIGNTATLRMDAATLQSLEILSSTVDGSERGALISFVDHASTPAGRRLLRRWLAEPLVSAEAIEDRLNAVGIIHAMEDEDGGGSLRKVSKMMASGRDLERALPKLHQHAIVEDSAVMFDDTNKRRVKEFVSILRSLQSTLKGLELLREMLASVSGGSTDRSLRLQYLLREGAGAAVPPEASSKLEYFLGEAFDLHAAEKDGEMIPNDGAAPEFDAKRLKLANVENGLEQEIRHWRQELHDKSISFYHRGKEPYQLQVNVSSLRGGTPDEFELASETKAVRRYYTREIKSLVRKHVEASEAFEIATKSVARDIVRQFDEHYDMWSEVIRTMAEVDALMGIARASRDSGCGPMCRPTILPNKHPYPVFDAEQLRHPILAAMSSSFVPNDVALGGEEHPQIAVLTGPNTGGKSTLSRQVAVAAILAQVGCYVPAIKLTMRPFEDVYVRMGACDDLARGLSTFMRECEEVGNILNHANSRSLVIADEVGRGTSTHDGYAVAYATLDYIARRSKCLTVFSTHYSLLGNDIAVATADAQKETVGMYEMAASVDEAKKQITFLYQFKRGTSGHSRGVYCARVAGIPGAIADEAEAAAARFEQTLANRLNSTSFQVLSKALARGDRAAAEALRSA